MDFEKHTQKDIYNIIKPILEKNKVPDWNEISKEVDEEFIELYNLTGIF